MAIWWQCAKACGSYFTGIDFSHFWDLCGILAIYVVNWGSERPWNRVLNCQGEDGALEK